MNKDPRNLGTLFYATCEELKHVEAMIILIEKTVDTMMENSKELIRSLINRFMDKLPQNYRTRPLFSSKNKIVSS